MLGEIWEWAGEASKHAPEFENVRLAELRTVEQATVGQIRGVELS